MTNFIPIFPLGVVVYPGESLNLHIFEARYKQMILECFEEKKNFGIPVVLNNSLQDIGTLIKINEITTVHPNGELDIKTSGEKVFRVLEIIKEIPQKLYSGAIVTYPDNHTRGNTSVMQLILKSIQELHRLLKIEKDFKKVAPNISTYDVAHHIGLSLEEEYELLNLLDERQRLEYLKRHLAKVIPMVAEMESLKDKIKLNGHFKNLSGFNLGL